MEHPLKDDTDDYQARLEEYCDDIEDSLKKSIDRRDYWCTQCTEARTKIKHLEAIISKLKRERTL